jgi:TAG lipase / steryl ester hydrolase / phospholipase A2 / LPA acyltransferase
VKMANEMLMKMEQLLDRRGSMGQRLASQLAYLISMLEQNYLGDINVLMEKGDFKWRQTVFEFREGEVEELIAAGMRRTWPKLSMIRNAALISKTLDRILEELNQEGVNKGKVSKHHLYV